MQQFVMLSLKVYVRAVIAMTLYFKLTMGGPRNACLKTPRGLTPIFYTATANVCWGLGNSSNMIPGHWRRI